MRMVKDVGPTDAREEALLPCPFCGQQPEVEPWHGGAPTKVMISCVGLHPEAGFIDCGPSPSVTGETPKEAARLWNTRALPTGEEALITPAMVEAAMTEIPYNIYATDEPYFAALAMTLNRALLTTKPAR